MKLTILILCTLALSSCATTKTAEDFIQKKSTRNNTFEINMNYQQAYKILSEMSRKCLQVAYAGNQIRTEEALDTQKKIGWVKLVNQNAILGTQFFGYYQVSEKAAGKTEVALYVPASFINQHSRNDVKVKSWIEGNKKCKSSRLK